MRLPRKRSTSSIHEMHGRPGSGVMPVAALDCGKCLCCQLYLQTEGCTGHGSLFEAIVDCWNAKTTVVKDTPFEQYKIDDLGAP